MKKTFAIRKPRGAGGDWLHDLVGHFLPDLREVWITFGVEDQPFGGGFRMDIHITPAIIWTPWQQSVLATMPELGIVTRSGSIGVEWWTWRATVRYGLSRQNMPNAGADGRGATGQPMTETE